MCFVIADSSYYHTFVSVINYKGYYVKKYNSKCGEVAFFFNVSLQTMHKQMLDLRSQVDEIRDQAIDLMSKSDRYNRMVEPELSHINQRWEELAEKIRVHSVLFLLCCDKNT